MTKTQELIDKAENKCKQYGIMNPFGYGHLSDVLGFDIMNPIDSVRYNGGSKFSHEDFFTMYENGHLNLITAILKVGISSETFEDISKILMKQKAIGDKGQKYLNEVEKKLNDYVDNKRKLWEEKRNRIKQKEYTKAFYLTPEEVKELKGYFKWYSYTYDIKDSVLKKLKNIRQHQYYFSFEEVTALQIIIKYFIGSKKPHSEKIAKSLLKNLKP